MRPGLARFMVAGDVEGRADVRLRPDGAGTRLTLAWQLHGRRRLLRALNLVARPVLVHGHHRVVDDGRRRFASATGLDLQPLRRG